MDIGFGDIILEIPGNNRKEILLLQKEMLPDIKIEISEEDEFESDHKFFDIVAVLSPVAIEFFKSCDEGVIELFTTRLIAHVKSSKGSGKIKLSYERFETNLKIEFESEFISAEHLLLSLGQFIDIANAEFPFPQRYIYDDGVEKKVTFIFNKKTSLLAPVDYAK